MKAKIILSVIFTLFVSVVVVFNSYDVASANQNITSFGKGKSQAPSLGVRVTFENGNCDGIFVQIKTPGGSVVLQGYTSLNSGVNEIVWSTILPPFGEYVAVAYHNGNIASTDFKYDEHVEIVPVHFNSYAECGDE